MEGDARLPVRLLFVGLPLTMVLGTIAAKVLVPEAGWAAAALIATILAPTDAALGLAVVVNPAVPARIRRALNVESGLNDGIATPFVTLFLTLVLAEEGLESGHWAAEAAKDIGLAIVAAVAVGVIGGKLLVLARERGWTSAMSEELTVLALALLSYVGAVAIGGNGFVAAFVGGLLFGASTASQVHEPVEFTETIGLFASFFVWTVFGALFVGPAITGHIDPVAIALRGGQPHGRADGAGGGGTGRHGTPPRHGGLHGMVRTARSRVGRVHADRGRGAARCGSRCPRHRGVRHLDDPALGRRPRPLGRAPRTHLRPSPGRGDGHPGAGGEPGAADPETRGFPRDVSDANGRVDSVCQMAVS